ncbi:hypothetical protein HDV05_005315 [Chytridiales sp. JEL 0842]|nr:hypothetical protein HDV05_005315 [Chytridiales sp. JEL 0842]
MKILPIPTHLKREKTTKLLSRAFPYQNIPKKGGDPPTLTTLLSDILFFRPILTTHLSEILCFHAGFLGKNWGEWWGSYLAPERDPGTAATTPLHPNPDTAQRNMHVRIPSCAGKTVSEAEDLELVRDAKRLVVDSLRSFGLDVCLRYPRDISNYFDGEVGVGWCNDAILAHGPGGQDAGTFDKGGRCWVDNDIVSAQNYARDKILGIRGGECCDDAGHPPTLEELLEYVKEYKLCYLNMEYPNIIFEEYKKGNPLIAEIGKVLKENGERYAEGRR